MRRFPPGHDDLRTWIATDPKRRRAALREALGVSHSAISQMLQEPPGMTPDEVYWPAIEVLTDGAVKQGRWRLDGEIEREREAITRAALLRAKLEAPIAPEAS